jgi:hypothetical protein
MLRVIEVQKSPNGSRTDRDVVAALLPENYMIRYDLDDRYVVVGEDVLGWTAKQYVLPRLASALIAARLLDEIIAEERYLAGLDQRPADPATLFAVE